MIVSNDILLPMVFSDLARGVDVVMSTKGNSMLPFIHDGDSVTLRRKGVRPGDIVLARDIRGSFIMHRVLSMEGDILILKGDGNLKGTEVCKSEDVAGVVMNIRRRGSSRIIDCTSGSFEKRSRRWNSLPQIVRRYYLGVLRRLIKKTV